jgi:serine protease
MKHHRRLIMRLGAALAGLALLTGLGGLAPEPTAPQDLVKAATDGPITCADPDGPGPLPEGPPRLEGVLVVDLVDGLTPGQVAAVGERHGLELRYNSPHSLAGALTVARVPEARMALVLESLLADPEVQAAEPDYLFQGMQMPPVRLAATPFPDDPLYKYQWHMEQIRVRQAWPWSTGRHAVVAVIDTGVAWTDHERFHRVEDLEGTRFVPGYDFVNRNHYALDDHAHGTHVAGTVAQTTHNGKGVAGVAFDAAIMPIKVLSARGFGSLADIADGIRFAADHGANVINMSLGGPVPSSVLGDAVRYAHRRGTLVVAAAGNESRPRPSYPAAFPESLSVSALDFQEELTFYTNHGPDIDLAAPGGDTRADRNGDGKPDGVLQNTIQIGKPEKEDYLFFQGTSMAAPHVAGASALLASQGVTSPSAARSLLKATARSKGAEGKARGYGAGVLDVERATWRAGFVYGAGRLVMAGMAGLLALAALARRGRWLQAQFMWPGLLLGSSGAFFLPLLLPQDVAFSPFLTTGIPAWDIPLLGAAAHANPLFYSCLIPMAASMLVIERPFLRALVAGLAAGFAGHLLFEALVGSAQVQYVPAFLSRLWLVGHGLLCMFLSQVLGEEAQ